MAIGGSQWGDLPGLATARESYENIFSFGRKENGIIVYGLIDGASTDSGASPTSNLRAGLLLGMVTSSGKYKPYAAANTDGTGVASAVLMTTLRTTDIFTGSTQDRLYGVLVGGPVQASRLIGLDNKARADLNTHFLLDDDFPNIVRYYPILKQVAKTTTYTILATDNGTFFTTDGAAGTVAFTLPVVGPGYYFEFLNTTGNTMSITSTTAVFVTANNAAATTISFQTSSELIGAHCAVFSNAAGTAWYVRNLSPSLTGGHSALTWTIT